jgi:anti-anti-sigma factor
MLKVHNTKLGNVAVLCVQGRIVRGETEALRKAVLAQTEKSVIVLDLARVNTIDAGGLGVMLELREFTESRGIEFRLRNVTKLVRRILEITRLDSVFKVTAGADVLSVPSLRRPVAAIGLAHCA